VGEEEPPRRLPFDRDTDQDKRIEDVSSGGEEVEEESSEEQRKTRREQKTWGRSRRNESQLIWILLLELN